MSSRSSLTIKRALPLLFRRSLAAYDATVDSEKNKA
jgi:hypothetical protein